MSRALTVFSRKEQREANADEVERVMEEQGCSEPVARNMLKCAKLGMGPLVNKSRGMEMVPRDLPDVPARFDRRAQQAAQAALVEQKMRQKEEEDEDKPAKTAGGSASGGSASVPSCFEMAGSINKPKPKKIGMVGISRLGPVEARQEEVDPLKPARVLEQEPEDEQDQVDQTDQVRSGIESFSASRVSENSEFAAAHERRVTERKRQREDDKRGHGKKKNRKKESHLGAAADDSSDEDGKGKNAANKASSHEPVEEEIQPRSGGLMSEEEVKAMLNKGRKTQRGSYMANARIKREMQEWEKAKASNPDYWKPPKFALCFSAETQKNGPLRR